jgi:CDP-diacylglycerol---serine O-phosphatidyltransferase
MNEATREQEPKRRPRQRMYAVIPTLLTLGNAVCGFGSITFAAMVGPVQLLSTPAIIEAGIAPTKSAGELLFISAGLIFLAMVFDALDGSVARLTKQTSDFGAQLDSMCDVVSFGVAPAFLMLKLMHPHSKMMESIATLPIEYHPRLLWTIAVLYMTCAILRLARFNNETDESDSHEDFKGLPSPAAAGVIASFPIGLQGLKYFTADGVVSGTQQVSSTMLSILIVLLPIITIFVASLMVSRIRYPHLINQLLRGSASRRKVRKMIFTGLLVILLPEVALPLFFCYFAFAAPIRIAWLMLWARLGGKKLITFHKP